MSECVKFFKENKKISPFVIMRRHKLSFDMGKSICLQIEKRFPNLWRNS